MGSVGLRGFERVVFQWLLYLQRKVFGLKELESPSVIIKHMHTLGMSPEVGRMVAGVDEFVEGLACRILNLEQGGLVLQHLHSSIHS